jgi:hypothetical protein
MMFVGVAVIVIVRVPVVGVAVMIVFVVHVLYARRHCDRGRWLRVELSTK